MALWQHPDWPDYKAALARMADASTRVDAARDTGGRELAEADLEFQEALAAYEALHARIHGPAQRG